MLNKSARVVLYLLGYLVISPVTHAQTVVYSEDFESGSPGIVLNTLDLGGTLVGENPWTINAVYDGGSDVIPCVPPIPLVIPPTPLQPAGIFNFPTSTYLHVTPQTALDLGGLLPAASYTVADGICLLGNQSTFSGMSADISTIGHDSVTFDLWWMCGGSALYYGEVFYSIDGGTVWQPVINPLNGTNKWMDQLTWTNTIITDPNWDDQPALRFGFRFITGSGVTGTETHPGFAIDDIAVTGYDVCTRTYSSFNAEACNAYSSPSGDYTWTQSGTYTDTIPNAEGCDSVMTIDLTVHSVSVTVTQTGITLTANEDEADYQWLNCNDGHIAIALATNQTLATGMDGNYAVQVSKNGCTDTSDCYTISGTGFYEFNPGAITVQPNPAHNQVLIITPSLNSGILVMTDLTGRELIRQPIHSERTELLLDVIQQRGVYLVKVITDDGATVAIVKLVIE